jgi:hypothetical protein
MASQQNLTSGLTILNGYKPDGVTWNCDAQHDVLHATGPRPEDLSEAHKGELASLGFRWDSELECWSVFT